MAGEPQIAQVRLRLPDGSEASLLVGGIIGRLWTADLQLNSPQISEVHAYLSLREGQLKLLPLRGGLWLYGLQVREVALEVGMEIELTEGVRLSVMDVQTPAVVAALEINGRTLPLPGSVAVLDDAGELTTTGPGLARIWSTGAGWFLQPTGGTIQRLRIGEPHAVGPLRLALSTAAVRQAQTPETVGSSAHHRLRILARFDSVQIHREGLPPTRLTGMPARLLTVLAELDGPAHWEVVAGELWSRADRGQRRRRWDRLLWTLRQKLLSAGVRPDLVTTASGQVELLLLPDDRCEISG